MTWAHAKLIAVFCAGVLAGVALIAPTANRNKNIAFEATEALGMCMDELISLWGHSSAWLPKGCIQNGSRVVCGGTWENVTGWKFEEVKP